MAEDNTPAPPDGDDATLVIQSGQDARPAPPPVQAPAPRKPGRWETRSRAILVGSLVGLAIAAVIAVLLVIFVPADDDAKAGADDDATPPASPTAATTPTPAQTPVPVEFTGSWISNFATVRLIQDGDSVTGEYVSFLETATARTIRGTLSGRTLTGTFDGDMNPMAFELSDDGLSFTGFWQEPSGARHEWCGRLGPPLQDGCGYSGDWRVKGFPPAADLEGDTIRLEQEGDKVTMSFQSGDHGPVSFTLEFDGVTLALAKGTAQLSGGASIQFEFLVTEKPEWSALEGTWQSGGQSGEWCAAQGDEPLPC